MIELNEKPKIILCQSCIERGYSNPQQATREWTPGYFICEDCFNPLIENVLGNNKIPEALLSKSKDEYPELIKVYEVLEIPFELQFTTQEDLLHNQDKFFNVINPAIINLSMEDLVKKVDYYKCCYFSIRRVTDIYEQRISNLKARKREELNIQGLDKSIKEEGKKKTIATKKQQSLTEQILNNAMKAKGIRESDIDTKIKELKEKEAAKKFGISIDDIHKLKEQKKEKISGDIIKKKINPITGKSE